MLLHMSVSWMISKNVAIHFLTDEDVPVALSRTINKVAEIKELNLPWRAQTVFDIGRTGLEDVDQLVYARLNGCILLTCDRYRDYGGQRVRNELLNNGGKIIQILGGPQTPIHQFLSLLMVHYEKWCEHFERSDGIFIVNSVRRVRFRTPSEFSTEASSTGGEQLTGYESTPKKPRQVSKRGETSKRQGNMDL